MQIQEISQPPDVTYPKISFWKEWVAKRRPLRFINPGDFPRERILNSLGILASPLAESFGVSDPEEIRRRQEVMRYLVESPDFRRWLLWGYEDSPLPLKENAFLRYFDPEREHNPYWKLVHDFIEFLCTGDLPLPPNLQTLLKALEQSLALEECERQLGQMISELVKNIAVIEGIMTFSVSAYRNEDGSWKVSDLFYEHEQSSVHGHRMFSSALTELERYKYPEWYYRPKSFQSRVGLKGLHHWKAERFNAKQKREAYQGMVIDKVSDGLLADIAYGLVKQLNSFSWDESIGSWLSRSKLKVYFSYSRYGLQVRTISWEPSSFFEPAARFDFADYQGYSEAKLALIAKAHRELINEAKEQRRRIEAGLLTAKIEAQGPNFLREPFLVDSPRTDREHRWFALSNLYQSNMLQPVYQALLRHREFFNKSIGELKNMAILADKLSRKAQEIGSPLCWPEFILDGRGVVAFEEVYPLHLLGKVAKPVAIRKLSDLNGQMVVFTGKHGGGKTVTSLAIAENIFLAQSGLPVFGRGFRLNPKKILGLVFIERGDGSTAEMLVKKIVNIMKGIRKVDGSQVVLVFDELGAGTQEVSGLTLGQDLLTKLSERNGISIVFNTQITSLAEFAQSKLGARCFQLDANHQILPGIGPGGMDELRDRLGLNRLL